MDKAERVAKEIWRMIPCGRDEEPPPLIHEPGVGLRVMKVDDIAAILRREYGDVRREALEEAARICDQHALNWENGRITSASMDRVAQARMDAAGIRAAKEER